MEILRDRWGVPHIFAEDLHDLYFAQGFCHAQDRLWQMEFNRRLASGRLSEVLGPHALEVDRLMRRIGLHRAAARDAETANGDETRAIYQAYVAGVNAFLEPGRPLPPEFTLLRFRPEPWEASDTALTGRLISFGQGLNWDTEIARSRLVAAAGPELAAELEPAYPAGMPLAVPPGAAAAVPSAAGMADLTGVTSALGVLAGRASNNWAIDGSKSASGSPLLASDPHIPPTMPCTWYEVHLVSPEHKVAGASLVGMPGVAIGHNERIAWGITNGMVDTSDVYVERVDPENPRRYQHNGWREGEIIREEIRVRGRREHMMEEVLMTHHGPDIGPALPGETRHLTLRSIALDGQGLVWPGHSLSCARDWDSFRGALRGWETLAMNFVYADVDGNIGYQFAGRVPVRGRGRGLLPSPGWDPAYEWTGVIPFEDLPHAFNPPSHVVASANARVVGDDYPHHLSYDWADGYRHQRIVDVLSDGEALTVDDMVRLQVDDLSLPARELMSFIRRLQPQTDLGRAVHQLLLAWDCQLAADSAGGAAFEAFLIRLYRLVFEARLGDAVETYMGKGVHPVAPANGYAHRAASNLVRVVREARADWFPQENGSRPTWESIGALALGQAATSLSERLGDDIRRWRWGDLHQIRFEHALGRVRSLRWLFSRGPYGAPGDPNTVFQNAYHPLDPFNVTLSTASYRQVIDLRDLNNSRSTIYGGQCGHPLSRHYDDRIEGWLLGESHPMPWDRDRVEQVTEATLTLSTALSYAPERAAGRGMRSASAAQPPAPEGLSRSSDRSPREPKKR